ncbi:hypothetical protein IMG5_200940 [Ichthyophthirius multifiliis]|uniref:DNA 3'-5' helicase n=1 Tax=Ichthyophthirius multifiliis TaxID=5932 RepID=G0R5T3_ICHMU|nr:hypothetical protein IMG5_200940 [Ichthyophthirius multifiliis]EGR27154.1 hypothetical protein IMG5_200940 [Ichthyophthirius multifiliis]|eukprot:XP_004024038.1 hypothetical protein IMG5_200940 [Ichthyophthirius multifiliis]
MTLFSMYTAMSLDLTAKIIQKKLLEYSKNKKLPESTINYIEQHTNKFGCAFLYMYEQNYYLKIDQKELNNAIPEHQSLMEQVDYFPQQNENENTLENIFISGKARSGIIVLPCGAGKTLLGIIVAEKIKRSTLVICDIDTATKQWKTEFLRWTNIKEDKIVIRTGQRKDEIPQNGEPFILITTYKQLTSVMNRVNNQKKNNINRTQYDEMDRDVTDIIHNQQWGLCLADETQMSAAETYREIFKQFKFKMKIGLTATPYREDNRITDLFHMIGPKLYEVNISELIQDGHLAKPYCVVFRVKMAEKAKQLLQEKPQCDVVAYTGNQKKFKLLAYLIKLHEIRGDKILVFCDSIAVLEEFSKRLCYPVICGNVKKLDEKLAWLEMFRKGHINTLFLSRVGDTALDLPSANVLIQIGFHFGSRKQEVQRLGRIMRRKEGQKGEYNAYFYTIISKDTRQAQIYYHRQKCLVDLGLDFEVIDEDKLEYDNDILDQITLNLCMLMEQEDAYMRQDVNDD